MKPERAKFIVDPTAPKPYPSLFSPVYDDIRYRLATLGIHGLDQDRNMEHLFYAGMPVVVYKGRAYRFYLNNGWQFALKAMGVGKQ